MAINRRRFRNSSIHRRPRRVHRRDSPRSGHYVPMSSDPDMIRRGVRRRLHLGTLSALTTVLTFAAAMTLGGSFATAAMLIISLCSLTATLAFVLSARREETLHLELANDETKRLECSGVDGSLDTSPFGP
ncbi:hypothetical protein FRD01_20820 [Microvenator marinus]|uniref:Uncharacterized protein n=1 Tax=Microvenator marinus TaxID=2600177 RepID=A0A5B8XW35_9DELT|nr:hypothetical protein [Microvenator marinus]QED29634.1 hypothetical protein FRD01_20820 [Microvenator marinus]